MSSDSDSAMYFDESVLGRPQRARGAIQHRVHELVAVGGAEAPGELHRLADHRAKRHLGLELELVEPDEEQRVLDRIEEPRLAVAAAGEVRLELRMRAHHALDERVEVIAIRARHVLGVGELPRQLLPRAVIQLPAIERLQRELARDAACAAELLRRARHRRAAHSRLRSAAIASAVSMASPPLLPALSAARSSA